MSKNSTRKGLALGAGIALVASGFSFAPANAAGQDDKTFVSLSPRTGTEYAVLLDQTFDLKSNVIDSLAGTGGKDLKFLVSDPLERIFVDQSQISTDSASQALSGIAYLHSGTVTTVTGAAFGSSSTKHFVFGLTSAVAEGSGGVANKATDLNGLIFTRASATTASTAALDFGADDSAIAFAGGKSEPVVALNTRAAILANGAIDADLLESATITTSIEGKTISGGRAGDGSFVLNTETNANANDRLLRLVTTSTSTYSVTVTGWVDTNDNGLIDATEYTSPERTITFQKAGDVTAVTTLTPVVGAQTLVASISTTPTLNGNQVLAQNGDVINAAFTRSLSTGTVYSKVDLAGNTQSSAWNNTTKVWTVTVNTDADAADEASAPGTNLTDSWTGLVAPITGADNISKIEISTLGAVTITTVAEHKLASGDKVTVPTIDDSASTANDAGLRAAEVTAAVVTVTGASAFTYAMATAKTKPATAISDASILAANDTYTVATFSGGTQGLVDRVGAETYTAAAYIRTAASTFAKISTAAEAGVIAAATVSGEVATTGSATVQGLTYDDASGTNAVKVKTGELSVPVVFTALDEDGDALAAGRPVVVTLSSAVADTFKINGKSTTDTVLTDANGQAAFTVTSLNGRDTSSVRVTGVIENAVTVYADLQWEDQLFGLVDLASTGSAVATSEARTIQALGSYSVSLAVLDQWYAAPLAGAYRLQVTGEGTTSQFVTLTAGKADLTITDNGVFGTELVTEVRLQKASGSTWSTGTLFTLTADVVKTFKVNLGADGSNLYGTSADLSDKVAAKALLELDKRVESGSTPSYAQGVLVNGAVTNAATSAGKKGAVVTITGPSNILFSNGLKAARGSLTFLSGNNGAFEVDLFSTSAQTDTVVTVTSNGVSSTVKVSFTGAGIGEGTSLVVTMPAAVKPASTFQVKAKLSDVYGNGVNTVAGSIKVTYSGAGIVFGTLPTETDANGELMFSVLLGSNDTGSVNVTVSYDQNADLDFVDVKDLVTAGTTAITASGVVAASSDTKVNVGTFSGKLVVYALNAAGSEVSYKIAGKWVTQVVTSDLLQRYDRVVGATGKTIKVDIYVDGVLKLAKSVVTK